MTTTDQTERIFLRGGPCDGDEHTVQAGAYQFNVPIAVASLTVDEYKADTKVLPMDVHVYLRDFFVDESGRVRFVYTGVCEKQAK